MSIQASAVHASSPAGEPPPEDVDSFEVAIFTSGADGSPPRTVFPRSHPHLFRDRRWSRSWVPRDDGAESTFWSGHFLPTHVVADLLNCLVDPTGYTLMLIQGMIPQPPD